MPLITRAAAAATTTTPLTAEERAAMENHRAESDAQRAAAGIRWNA